MKKRILSLFLAICLTATVIVTLPMTASAAVEGLFTYTVSNGQATITDCSEYASGDIAIPGTLGGCPVIEIDNYAFQRCYSLTSIKIPDTVIKIGYYAFDYCENLVSVEIPESVTTIAHDVFERCYNLKYINVNENNPDYCSVDGNLFNKSKTTLINYAIGKNNTSYEIPDGVTSIIRKAFQDCENLTNITIPNSVKYIGLQAFSGCTKLENIKIGKNIETIEYGAFNGCWGIKNFEIPDKVTNIGDWAFAGCNFKSITIPDSVTQINANVFTNCSSLESVEIGSGVEIIQDTAFSGLYSLNSINVDISNQNYCSVDGILFNKNKTTLITYAIGKSDTSYEIPNDVTTISNAAFENSKLTNIKIPNSVTSVGAHAFSNCSKLTNITIPNSVTSIGTCVFDNCRKLESIKIPNSVIDIGFCAFSSCYNLTDVYYSGNEDDWTKIIIGSGNDELIEATIHYNAFRPAGSGYSEPTYKTGTFQFASGYGNKLGENGNSLANYCYDDNYFASSATNGYNHDLSKMSLRFAMSAFAVHRSGSNKYKNQAGNAEKLLNELGFEEIDNIGYTEQPSTNSIGVIAGNKRIAFADDDYTLIAVAIRGGGYESEWGGNFNVGSSEHHQGFQLARDQVLEFLTKYVRDAEIKGNIKIWITGFSRAAATANLTAAYLNTHSLILNGTNTDTNKIIQVEPENIYAYCFETPAGTRAKDRNNVIYNNIFSIVNQYDFVPMVAPEDWGYGRYGITYYLPSPKTHSNFRDLEIEMYSYYDEYVEHEEKSWRSRTIGDFDNYKLSWSLEEAYPYYGFYLKSLNSNQSMDDFLIKTIGDLTTEFPSAAYYEETLQDTLIYVGTTIMGQGNKSKIIETFKQEFFSRLNPFKIGFETIDSLSRKQQIGLLDASIRATFRELGVSMPDETVDQLGDLFYVLLKTGKLETLFGNLDILPKVHYPELCMAWLDSKTDATEYVGETRKVCLNCPVDFEVYDSEDNLVAAVYENVKQEIEGSSIVCYVDGNGQKVAYLPTDEEYRIEVIATDDGEVSYSVQEQNGTTGEVRLVNYNKMMVSKNNTLTGVAENLETVETASYTLTSNTVTISEPEIIENATTVSVTAIAEGNGNVSGGGNLYPGEYAQITATPYEGESFLGWYDGETLITQDSTYRFQVTDVVELTARFTENTCEILYMTAEEEIIAVDRIQKGTTVTFPAMNQNPQYMILGIYLDSGYTTFTEEETTYSADTVLYAKAVHEDEWVQLDKSTNEITIYSPKIMTDVKLMVALYLEGRLIGLQPATVSLAFGKNVFDSSVSGYGEADEIKLFVWENETTIKPLFHAGKTVIS